MFAVSRLRGLRFKEMRAIVGRGGKRGRERAIIHDAPTIRDKGAHAMSSFAISLPESVTEAEAKLLLAVKLF